MTIKEICALFNLGGEYSCCSEIPIGNVNSTYEVELINENVIEKYVLQRINKTAFVNPPQVMENIVRVTEHVFEKAKERKDKNGIESLQTFACKTGEPYVIDNDGQYWRCYKFINNAVTFDLCFSPEIARELGRAFGEFQKNLSDFNVELLHVTISDFHNTKKRYQVFRQAVADDPKGRVKSVREQIDKLFAMEERACMLQNFLDEGRIPYRVTHNDTKCNNVCFDKNTKKALAVLDLDTVMPGAVAYDFGDAIRSIANTTLEDDPNIEQVALDLNKYDAFVQGFTACVKEKLTDFEKQTLNLGTVAMTVEVAVRFLTDYILGDKYFKTRYPKHNLDRTINQIALAEDIILKMDKMQEILFKYV